MRPPECQQLQLRPATLGDVPLLERWDSEPHIIAAKGEEDWQWEQELVEMHDWHQQLIAEVDGVAIGYLAILDPQRCNSQYWGSMPPGYRALDIWIGEADMLRQGWGTQMMMQVLDHCFANPAVHTILLDPLQGNTAAHDFYRSLGFRKLGERHFGTDLCLVMTLKKRFWNRTPGYSARETAGQEPGQAR